MPHKPITKQNKDKCLYPASSFDELCTINAARVGKRNYTKFYNIETIPKAVPIILGLTTNGTEETKQVA